MSESSPAHLTLRGVDKVFTGGRTVHALSHVDLEVSEGELVTLVGPSGCGKSTLLKLVAGLDRPTAGELLLDGTPITGPGPDRAVVFQEHRLMPWLTVERNIAANLSLRRPEIRAEVDRLLAVTGLRGFEHAYPKELSGGMLQRVAIARALLRNPAIMLLDEPFGALDAFTRTSMQQNLLDVWAQNRTTMLFVTHDIEEAITLGDRIVLMSPRPGRIDRVLAGITGSRERDTPEFEALRTEIHARFRAQADEERARAPHDGQSHDGQSHDAREGAQ